jgi:hypothetical protein
MKEIIKKPWDYVFSETNGKYYITVTCGTTAVFDLTMELNAGELSGYEKSGEKFLDELSGQVRYSPDDYVHRHQPEFS